MSRKLSSPHGDGPEHPDEQSQRHVEGAAEAQQPGVAATVHRARHVRCEFRRRHLAAGRQAAEQEAGMRVHADALQVADEGEHDAERDDKVLGREHLPGLGIGDSGAARWPATAGRPANATEANAMRKGTLQAWERDAPRGKGKNENSQPLALTGR